MERAIVALTNRLTNGVDGAGVHDESPHGFVETLAGAYEKARNALEYRADNLVRRAAIERMLKRLMFLNNNPETLSGDLLTELRWARYLTADQITISRRKELTSVLGKYVSYTGSVIPREWIIKIASAEVEELFNLNKDYAQFTYFTFQALKQKIDLKENNLDLLIFFAVDKVYAASDPEQIAYHIIRLAGLNIDTRKMEEGWRLFTYASASKTLPRINKFVRRQMPPLILLRDIYFFNPVDFKSVVISKEKFIPRAHEVLDIQLKQLSKRISTAGFRSVIYVFLTKMVLAFGLETPLEMFIYGRLAIIPLILNVVFPPLLMWLTTLSMRIPSAKDRENLVVRTWFVVDKFEELGNEDDKLIDEISGNQQSLAYIIFSGIYGIFFIGVFLLIFYVLGLIGFTFFSQLIFIFLLTIIAFFAYRIIQLTKVYSWKNRGRETPHLTDMVFLPILTIGSKLSSGLSHLNFIGFIFDFILEAPFKLILGVVDDWVHFLSIKKEQQILD